MFSIRNIPVVIEPGVAALETEFSISSQKEGERLIPVHLKRVPLDSKTAEDLPFIPTTKLPHVFSPTLDLKKTATLVVYDFLGRLSTIYTRHENVWERSDVAEEHAGKTVTQFSVRLSFSSAKNRDKFLIAMEHMINCVNAEKPFSPEAMSDAVRLLSRSRVAPVVLPIAVAKSELKKIKL
jgi:hypothetical protein